MAQADNRLNSWKEIAAYLKRGARTVQRWDREEGLPVHRLRHDKLGSVFAYRTELDAWWARRSGQPEQEVGQNASIAVLPFSDLSEQHDQQYFCDGLAEEITSALSKVGGLRVASRTSAFHFRGEAAGRRGIGRSLHVGALLTGSVRRSEDRLRVHVELVDAESGFQLWSERYDRDASSVFDVQDEIAASVVRELEITLSPKESQQMKARPTSDPGAFECYARGRAYYARYSPRDVEFAIEMFSRAAQLDPNYARAYAGLADCWSYLYLYQDQNPMVREQAEWASAKAVEMDPSSPEAQAARGLSLSIGGNDEDAERAFEASIALDPELYEAHYYYARHCFARGRLEEAAGHYQAAIAARPDDFQAPLLVAQIYDSLQLPGKAREARLQGTAAATRHLRLNPDDARALYMAANGFAALGDPSRAREWLNRALLITPGDPMLLYNAGCIHSMLGDSNAALDRLEQAVDHGLIQAGWFLHDGNLDPLRHSPRFERLIQRLVAL